MEGTVLKEDQCYMIGSPVGDLKVVYSSRGLSELSLIKDPAEIKCFSGLYDNDGGDALAAVKTFVGDLFFCREPGRRGIDLDMDDMSEFRRSVYLELMKVPFGELITYGELACKVGKPGGARAVGQAVNKNPFLLVIPCHRVVASGKMTAYELGGFGAGLDVKRILLRLEGHSENEISGL